MFENVSVFPEFNTRKITYAYKKEAFRSELFNKPIKESCERNKPEVEY